MEKEIADKTTNKKFLIRARRDRTQEQHDNKADQLLEIIKEYRNDRSKAADPAMINTFLKNALLCVRDNADASTKKSSAYRFLLAEAEKRDLKTLESQPMSVPRLG